MQVLVGDFNEDDLKNKRDKIAVEQKKKETGLNYVNSKIIKHNGKMVALRLWVCDVQDMQVW